MPGERSRQLVEDMNSGQPEKREAALKEVSEMALRVEQKTGKSIIELLDATLQAESEQ